MPFCPSCRQEFLPGVERCPDCREVLVEELAPPRDVAGEGWLPLRVAAELIEDFTGFCTAAELPWRQEGQDLLLLGGAGAGRLLGLYLERREEVVLDPPAAPGEPHHLRSFDSELDGEIRECDLLARPESELAGDEEALDRLVEVAIKGEVQLSLAAVAKLGRLGEGGLVRLAALLGQCCLAGEDLLLRSIVKVLAGRRLPGLEEVVRPLLEAEDPRVVVNALHCVWGLELRALADPVCRLLLHEDEEVQREADEVLVEFTGRDLDFDPGLDREEKIRIMEERRAGLGG